MPDPDAFLKTLKRTGLKVDILTFAQRLPDVLPKFKYHLEWDNFAIIPITTFSDWWEKRVESSVRRAVRKAAKSDVVVSVARFDDTFVQGIVDINNETPIRQGKPFWHFQKSFDSVKSENSTYADRNTFIGAYYQGQLIGFIRMTQAGQVSHIIQLLTMTKHFDKRPANALVAKAVEVCAEKSISYLQYCNYTYNDPNSSLTEFKRRNGFEQILVPRFYVPLTTKGRIVLSAGLHRGLAQRIPKPLLSKLVRMKSRWHTRTQLTTQGAV